MPRTTNQPAAPSRLQPTPNAPQEAAAPAIRAEPGNVSNLERQFAALSRPTGNRSGVVSPFAPVSRTANFDTTLTQWAESGPSGQLPARRAALRLIKDAKEQQHPELDLSELTLTSLPECLGTLTGLERLDISDNCLTDLPPLPPDLVELRADNNRIARLPPLPASLQYLIAESNQLTELPRMPARITELLVGGNLLTRLPHLPDQMAELSIRDNRFTQLPAIPPGLWELDLSGNDWSDNALHAIDRLPASIEVKLHASPPESTVSYASDD